MTDLYYVITCNDGETYIEAYTKERFLQKMNEEDGDFEGLTPLADISEQNTNYWKPDSYLVIKGSIVLPKPVQIVKEWDI